jgi:radical SAM superfamily enzyme YgiQ (UPF0313 family)
MITSLGCPHRCSFCEAGGQKYNARTPETVVNEMKECYGKYGVREIDIFDYLFTADRKRVSEICRLIKKEKLDIDWACRSRVDSVDAGLLKEMGGAGCKRIYWGIEHALPCVLDKLNKGITTEQVSETIRASRKAGIENLGFFLVGVPGETRETVKRTVGFARHLRLEYVQFSKLLAKPMTPLWKDIVAATGKDYWRDWVLGEESDRELDRPWLKTITNDELNRLTKWAYLRYHSHPLFLLRHTLQCQSFLEFMRKLSAYLSMLLFQETVPRPVSGFRAYHDNPLRTLITKLRWVSRNKGS